MRRFAAQYRRKDARARRPASDAERSGSAAKPRDTYEGTGALSRGRYHRPRSLRDTAKKSNPNPGGREGARRMGKVQETWRPSDRKATGSLIPQEASTRSNGRATLGPHERFAEDQLPVFHRAWPETPDCDPTPALLASTRGPELAALCHQTGMQPSKTW